MEKISSRYSLTLGLHAFTPLVLSALVMLLLSLLTFTFMCDNCDSYSQQIYSSLAWLLVRTAWLCVNIAF